MIRIILCFILIPFISFSQDINDLFSNRGEVYFSFQYKNKNQLDAISDLISIDHKTNAEIAFAYANKKEYTNFLKLGINHNIIPHKPKEYTHKSKNNWDFFPS